MVGILKKVDNLEPKMISMGLAVCFSGPRKKDFAMTRVYQISSYRIPKVSLKFELFSRTYLRVCMSFDYERTEGGCEEPLILYSRGVNTVQIVLPYGSTYDAHFRPINHPREDSYLVLHRLPKTGKITIYSHLNPSLNSPRSGLYLDGDTLVLDGNKDGLMYATYYLPTFMANLAHITTKVIAREIPHPFIDASGRYISEESFEYTDADRINLKFEGVFKFIRPEDIAGKWHMQTRSTLQPLHLSQFNLQVNPKPFPALLCAYKKQRAVKLTPTVHPMIPSPAHSPGIQI